MLVLPRSAPSVRSVVAAAASATVAALLFSTAATAGGPEETAAVTGAAAPAAPVDEPEPAGQEPLGDSETGLWVVQLTDPSLAAHLGSPAANVASPDRAGYLDYLAQRQDAAAEAIESRLGRSVRIPYAYRNVLNALTVEADRSEAAALAALPGVATVYPDQMRELATDVSQELIRAPAVWDGETGPELATRGEGVVTGLLDSGINPEHPAFAATADDGYTHTNPYGSGEFVGVCDPEHEDHEDICNDKLIGAWDFVFFLFSDTARDENGHGSHVASTMAGNPHEVVFTQGGEQFTRTVQGTAPRANVISYKVCDADGDCAQSAMLAGIDQAIDDGVDVLNFSISGEDDPWDDPVSLAFLEAARAGVVVSAAAGNSGPFTGSAANTAPWNATVAATNTDRLFANDLAILGPQPVPPELALVRAWPTDAPPLAEDLTADLRFAGDEGSASACSEFPVGTFDGSVALVRVGSFFDCALDTKLDNTSAAGAEAVLLYETRDGVAPTPMGGLAEAPIPAFSVGNVSGEALADFAGSRESVQARLSADTELVRDDDLADVLAGFSSRGPSRSDVLAPSFAAPGRNVLAAYREIDGEPVQYRFISGTSMASPHAAGAGALLTALHPDWTPAEIISALTLTADPEGLRLEDGTTAASTFDVGAGRMDLARASRTGLVLDEDGDAFEAADPESGGQPHTLNIPSLVNHTCTLQCSWTREFTSVADTAVEYRAEVAAPEGMQVSVEPTVFTLEPGAQQDVQVTVDVTELPVGEWQLGALRLTTEDTHAGGAQVTSARLPLTVIPVVPELELQPAELASAQKPDQQRTERLAVSNQGDGPLQWRLDSADPACDAPSELDWLTAAPQEGTVDPGQFDTVVVTLDATGLAPQELTATVCLASNDPARQQAGVPVTLTVQDLPTMTVDPPELSLTQPAGTVAGTDLEITNTGTAPLEWEIAAAGEATAAAGGALAGVDPRRQGLLRDGLLLIPDSTRGQERVMAFDPETGDLVDEDFIPFQEEADLGTPKHIILNPDQDGFLLSDQSRNVVNAYDLNGQWQGVAAPTGGEDTSIIRNIRGIVLSPEGTLLVTAASGDNADAVAEFDQDGNFLGNFVDNEAGGLDSPWFILFRDDDVLVSASTSDRLHRYTHDGAPLEALPTDLNFPAQVVERDNGNLLVAQFSAGGPGAGAYELTPDGHLLDIYRGVGNDRGVYELPNGNLLTTNSGNDDGGVYEIDRSGEIVDTKLSVPGVLGGPHMISHVQLDSPCVDPGAVPWLETLPAGGAVAPGESETVRVRVDSTGLAAGEHTAQLCVSGNDPENELVEVSVSVTVTEPACDRTVTGRHLGALTVTDGLTCIAEGAQLRGPVTVGEGASLFASGASVAGPVMASGAAVVELRDSTVRGPVLVHGGTSRVVLSGNEVTGPVWVTGNRTGDQPVVVSGNTVVGLLSCTGNQPPPTDAGAPNRVTGPVFGQCADLT